MRLTVQDAEALALKNNPQISVYRLLYLASKQVTRQQQAAYYPTIYGSLTAVEPKEGSRIAAGNLNNPIVYERAAGGLTLSQMITDFGRTNNLVAIRRVARQGCRHERRCHRRPDQIGG